MARILTVNQIELAPGRFAPKSVGGAPLRRVLGLSSLLGVGAGLVVSQGAVIVVLQGFGYSGMGFIVPLFIAFVLALSYAASFAELSLMIPKAGSLGSYSLAALGQLPALLAVFCGYVLVIMFAMSAEIGILSAVLERHLGLKINTVALGFLVLAVFTTLNLLKINIFAKVQFVLAFVMFIFFLLVGFSAFFGAGSGASAEAEGFVAKDFNLGSLSLVTLAFWAFVGVEFICPLVEETKKPEKNIAGAMYLSLILVLATFILYGLGALFYVSPAVLTHSLLPHYEYATEVLGTLGQYLIVIAVLAATCSTVNCSLAAIPRMLYGMARAGQALPQFKRLSQKNKVPWVAILFISGVSALPMLFLNGKPEMVSILIAAASLSYLIAYIINHLNVLALRRRFPHMARPYKTPFYPWPQIIGIVGLFYMLTHISPDPELAFKIYLLGGGVIALITVLSVLWIKFKMKKPLFKPEYEELLSGKKS